MQASILNKIAPTKSVEIVDAIAEKIRVESALKALLVL